MWAVKHFQHYGHPCTVLTDHEALKSLLNTPQPSGKLAQWGMTLQELDLKLEYHPGKANTRADALSRYPVSLLATDCRDTEAANIEGSSPDTEDEEKSLSEHQHSDQQLALILKYLEYGELPQDEKAA